jgi:O-antigen ligase
LIHPQELRHLTIGPVYLGVQEAHNNALNRWVEMGFFGLATYLILLGVVAVGGLLILLNNTMAVSQNWQPQR